MSQQAGATATYYGKTASRLQTNPRGYKMSQETGKTVIEKIIRWFQRRRTGLSHSVTTINALTMGQSGMMLGTTSVTTVAQFVTPRLSHTSARTFRISDPRQNEPSVHD